MLPKNEVQIWRADLVAIRSDEQRWQKILSLDEKKRASRFHFSVDRQNFVAARALLRIVLGGYLNEDPYNLTFSYSKKEKPSLSPLFATGVTFNVSHSGGVALYAFARQLEVGIDIERARQDFDLEAIARRFFSVSEQQELSSFPPAEKADAFFRCWTRKEAYMKATGDGLSLPLSQFDVSLEHGSEDALRATRPDQSEAGRWQLREIPAGPGYLGALCVGGRDWVLSSWE
jgi:4'-phosphopantetheinyl transferase